MRASALVSVSLAIWLVVPPAAASAKEPAFDHRAVAHKALEKHIRPGYARLADAAARLRERIEALCAEPSEAHIARAKAAFRDAVIAWGGVEHLRFGPVTEQNRYERIAFWPDPKGIGRRQVARMLKRRDQSVLDVDKLAEKSVALQGLTALELILYGSGGKALASPDGNGDFRCRYGVAVSRNLSDIAGDLVSAWSSSGAYAARWLAPGPDNPIYLDAKEVTRDLVRAYTEGLHAVREYKIAGPLGIGPSVKRKKRAAFQRSGLALPFITANVAGILDLFAAGGLGDELARRDPALVRSIRGELERVVEIGRSIDTGAGQRLSDPAIMDKLILMGFPLKSARENAGAPLAEASGLPIRFTDSDAN